MKMAEGRRLAERASRFFLLERIRVNAQSKRRAQEEVHKLEELLNSTLSDEDFERVNNLCRSWAEKIFHMTKDKHLKKFENLKTEGEPGHIRKHPELSNRWLVNMSKKPLSKSEEVLKLGLNFAPTPRKPPIIDFVTGVEVAAEKAKLTREHADEMKNHVCDILKKKNRRPTDNLTTPQRKALTSLKKREDIVQIKGMLQW